MQSLFSSSPQKRIRRTWIQEGDDYILHSHQNVTELLEECKGLYNLHDERSRFPGERFYLRAKVPMVVYGQLLAKCGGENEWFRKELELWINENHKFKTRPGYVKIDQ